MRTRQMLLDAFYELIQEHDFDDITVQMILDRAQLSRGTFYRYYEDKYDLMNSFYRDHVDNLLAQVGETISLRDAMEAVFHHIEQNKRFYRRAVKTRGIDSFADFLEKYSYDFYASRLPTSDDAAALDPETAIAIEMLCSCHIAALRKWVERDCPLSPEAMARVFYSFVPANVKGAIG